MNTIECIDNAVWRWYNMAKKVRRAKRKEARKMTLTLEKPLKNVLTQPKKEIFKGIIGKYSTKIDLNTVRIEWKNDKK